MNQPMHPLFDLMVDINRIQQEILRPTKPRGFHLDESDLPENWQMPPSPEDINRMAAIDDELRTEGRVHVNTRSQRHE